MLQQAACKTVTKCMGTFLFPFKVNSGFLEMDSYKRTNCTWIELRIRRHLSHKNMVRIGFGSCVLQIINDCFSYILQKRKFQRIPGFYLCQADDFFLPVDVRESEICNITATQTKSCNQKNNRVVTDSTRISKINRIKKLFYLVRRIR